jgi:DNA-directed RNA polymerase subunit RPC12/RpoP
MDLRVIEIRIVRRPRYVRPVLFIDADTIRVNCGRCGRELLVRIEDIRGERIIDCEKCRSSVVPHGDER